MRIGSFSAKRILATARSLSAAARHDEGLGAPAQLRFTARERRWLWVTEPPFLAAALAVAVWVPAQRPLNPLVCLLLIAGYAVACNVRIVLPSKGTPHRRSSSSCRCCSSRR